MLTPSQVYARIATSPYLPVLPEETAQLLRALAHPEEIDLDELAALVERDAELTDMMLSNLNTNGYAFRRSIESVKDAVLFLGMVSARNVLIFFITHKFFPPERAQATQLFTLYQYWQHVQATGIAADEIALLLGLEDPFRLFTYGLLHDLGILALDACLGEEEERIIARIQKGEGQLAAESGELGGLTHADIGAWVCHRESFPGDITDAVKHHHDPDGAQDISTARILCLANALGTEYVQPKLPVKLDARIDPALVRSLGVHMGDIALIRGRVTERMKGFAPRPIGL